MQKNFHDTKKELPNIVIAKWNPNGLYLLDSFGYWIETPTTLRGWSLNKKDGKSLDSVQIHKIFGSMLKKEQPVLKEGAEKRTDAEKRTKNFIFKMSKTTMFWSMHWRMDKYGP